MDETTNKWLWIGIGAVICIIILLLATPLGNAIQKNISTLSDNVSKKVFTTFNSTGATTYGSVTTVATPSTGTDSVS